MIPNDMAKETLLAKRGKPDFTKVQEALVRLDHIKNPRPIKLEAEEEKKNDFVYPPELVSYMRKRDKKAAKKVIKKWVAIDESVEVLEDTVEDSGSESISDFSWDSTFTRIVKERRAAKKE